MRISGFSSPFSAVAVFVYPPTNVLKALRPLRKSREGQKSSLVRRKWLSGIFLLYKSICNVRKSFVWSTSKIGNLLVPQWYSGRFPALWSMFETRQEHKSLSWWPQLQKVGLPKEPSRTNNNYTPCGHDYIDNFLRVILLNDCQITHLICIRLRTFDIWLLGGEGVLGLLPVVFLRWTQIRWVIWRSSVNVLAGAPVHGFLCNETFYVTVMANPMNYTQNSGFQSVISWRAVDYMKLM